MSTILIFSCTTVILMIVYSSCFTNILIIYSSLYSIELIILWAIVYGITIWVLFYRYRSSWYLINFVILLISMPISFIFYIKYYISRVWCHSVPISIPILVFMFFMYNIYCYYRLYLLTLSSGYILYSYDIVYLIINTGLVFNIGIILL